MMTFKYYFSFGSEDVKAIHEEIENLKIREWLQEYEITLIPTVHGFFIKSYEMLFMKEWDKGVTIGVHREPYYHNDVWDIEAMPEDIAIFTHMK